MAYGKSKDSAKRNRVLKDKAFEIANDPKYDGCQKGLASIVYRFFNKSLVQVVLTLNQIISLQRNFIGRLLENLRGEKFICRLETIFGVLI